MYWPEYLNSIITSLSILVLQNLCTYISSVSDIINISHSVDLHKYYVNVKRTKIHTVAMNMILFRNKN